MTPVNGEMPGGRRVRLGDVLSLEYGTSLPSRERDTYGKFPVAGSNGPDGKHSRALVCSPGVVVGRKGSAGSVYWYDEDYWPIDTTYYVVPKVPLEMRWVYYLLSYLPLRSLATTTGVPGLNRNDAYALEVYLPVVSEQRRIAEILDNADGLRRLRAEADTKAERIPPALFLKMFGDPVTNPMGWQVKLLGELGELERGRSVHRPRNDAVLLSGPHPFIQTGDVANCEGRIRSFTQTYSEAGLAQSKMWPAGTLCITIAANIASTGVLDFDACFPDSVVGFSAGSCTTTEYVQFFLFHLRKMLEHSAPRLAQRNINLQVLRSLPVPTPPAELQRQFSSYVREYYDSRIRQTTARNVLDKLFASTMGQAFSDDLNRHGRQHADEFREEMERRS